jgi:choline dehydrogenase-like flavoprotein
LCKSGLGDGNLTDIAHTSGTTRMSDDSKRGVVDSRSQVHGVPGLYIAGASVFPTSGHANPTLLIVALAIRLADQIKDDLVQ